VLERLCPLIDHVLTPNVHLVSDPLISLIYANNAQLDNIFAKISEISGSFRAFVPSYSHPEQRQDKCLLHV
jgi:hypothetical protein